MRDPQNRFATFKQERQQIESYGKTQIATNSKVMQIIVVVIVIALYLCILYYSLKIRF
jgi:hypothetical protein